MAPPQVSIYVTSLTSQPKVRQQTASLKRALDALEIPYTEHDLVNEPDAKTRWQRAKPTGMVVGLPGYLVGGEWVGTMEEFEQAVEDANLPSFLKQDVDLGSGNLSIGEAELEKLMREMTAEDLDALAAEMGADSSTGKVGLMVPEGAIPAEDVGAEEEKVEIGAGTAADPPSKAGTASQSAPKAAAAAAEDPKTEEGITGTIQSAAATVAETVKDVKNQIVDTASAAAPALHPVDPAAPTSAASSSDSPAPSPISATAPKGLPSNRGRRMSKEEIAHEMAHADNVDSLIEAVGKAGQKEKMD